MQEVFRPKHRQRGRGCKCPGRISSAARAPAHAKQLLAALSLDLFAASLSRQAFCSTGRTAVASLQPRLALGRPPRARPPWLRAPAASPRSAGLPRGSLAVWARARAAQGCRCRRRSSSARRAAQGRRCMPPPRCGCGRCPPRALTHAPQRPHAAPHSAAAPRRGRVRQEAAGQEAAQAEAAAGAAHHHRCAAAAAGGKPWGRRRRRWGRRQPGPRCVQPARASRAAAAGRSAQGRRSRRRMLHRMLRLLTPPACPACLSDLQTPTLTRRRRRGR